MTAPHNLRYDKPERTVEMDGASGPLAVDIAGYRYWFQVVDKSDCSFKVYEIHPDGESTMVAVGTEQ